MEQGSKACGMTAVAATARPTGAGGTSGGQHRFAHVVQHLSGVSQVLLCLGAEVVEGEGQGF